MNIHIKMLKTHEDAVLPTANNKQHATGDSGFDLTSVETVCIPARGSAVAPVGLTLADVTPGYWIRIEPRSGLGFKHNIQPHLGVIDNGYRGDLGVKLYNFGDVEHQVVKGDKIAQLVVYPLLQPVFEFTENITETTRGDKGFGSSDTDYKVKQMDDDWYYANLYNSTPIYRDGVKYIVNPMKIDQSDPDYIPDPDHTVTDTQNSTSYTAKNV